MIPGLKYTPNFISSDEQAELIQYIDAADWCLDLKRRTQHYGYKYDYTKKKIDVSMRLGEMPGWAQKYCVRLVSDGIFKVEPDQVIVNEYYPGQGISRHIDCVPCFGDTVCSLSLLSQCAMDFESFNKTYIEKELMLAPCSLLVLKNEARYKWMHSIASRKEDYPGYCYPSIPRTRRVSLTFRKVLL